MILRRIFFQNTCNISQVLSYHDTFLCHIAHISTMISRRIQSSRLKEKFDSLKRFSLEEYIGYDLLREIMAPVAHMELAAAVKVRLWKVLQSKFQDPVAVATLDPRDWTESRLDRRLATRITIGHGGVLAGDNKPPCHGDIFENLLDENRPEVFDDIVDDGSTIDDYEPIEHDAFDDLLYEANLTMEAPLDLDGPSCEPYSYLNGTSGIELQNQFSECTPNSLGGSAKFSVDSVSSSVCGSRLDELLDVLDQGPEVDADQTLLDDIPRDEGSRSLDPATNHGFHHEMMMDS